MIITRFPPSPTGDLHIGGVRTALYSWLVAKQNKGKFVLRIEDTDTSREKEDAVQGIIDGLDWLGLNYDDGPIFQTDRYDRYKEIVADLVEQKKAYPCFCSKERLDELREKQLANKEKPKYDGRCRDNSNAFDPNVTPIIRFKNPLNGEVSWDDLVHGRITFNNKELDDLIIARADGSPTYNFCVVVDDIDMNITHIIRGDDHINNTPRQINIFKVLADKLPSFGHVPMILDDSGKRLSKRYGAASVLEYRKAGYLPSAVLNYLVRLGWSYEDKEIFSVDEMIDLFDITRVNRSASTFNTEKLNWINQQHLKSTPIKKLVNDLAYQYESLNIDASGYDLTKIIPFYTDRAKTLKEMAEQSDWVFKQVTDYPEKQAKKAFHPDSLSYLKTIRDELLELKKWRKDNLHEVIEKVVVKYDVGFGKIGMPLRLALTGGKPSPGIDDIMSLLGKDKTIASIDRAINFLN